MADLNTLPSVVGEPESVRRSIEELKKTDTTHIRELTMHLHHEYRAPQHHPPMPPTKAMGVIKQNPRGGPTATP